MRGPASVKPHAGARQRPLAKALLEHGKPLRTVHAVRWFAEEVAERINRAGDGGGADARLATVTVTVEAVALPSFEVVAGEDTQITVAAGTPRR